jgi:hypothetical protein
MIQVKKNAISTARIDIPNNSKIPKSSSNKWIIWVSLGVFVVIVLYCMATSNQKRKVIVRQQQQYSRIQNKQLKKYKELDNKTMGQWMKDNKAVSRELKERKQRILKHTYQIK